MPTTKIQVGQDILQLCLRTDFVSFISCSTLEQKLQSAGSRWLYDLSRFPSGGYMCIVPVIMEG